MVATQSIRGVEIDDREMPPATEVRVLGQSGDIDVVIAAPGLPTLRRTVHGRAGSIATVAVPVYATASSVMLDRLDLSSVAGIEMSYVRPEAPDTTELRLGLHARYVDRARGVGGYVQIPIAHERRPSATTTAVGDLEPGGLFLPQLSIPAVGIALRGGITAPTGEPDGSRIGIYSGLASQSEFYNFVPRGITLELAMSVFAHYRDWFACLDLSVEQTFSARRETVDRGYHVNVGGGLAFDKVSVMLRSDATVGRADPPRRRRIRGKELPYRGIVRAPGHRRSDTLRRGGSSDVFCCVFRHQRRGDSRRGSQMACPVTQRRRRV